MKSPLHVLATLCVICTHALAADPPAKPPADAKPKAPAKIAEPPRPPTQANVAYGTHERQVLDFWKAESAKPTPLLFHIHGGRAIDFAVVAIEAH